MIKNTFRDLPYFVAHVVFFPLACITMIDETRTEWTGLGHGLLIDAALWACLITCGALILAARQVADHGALVSWGVGVFMVLLIVSIPILIGLALYVALIFVGGGFGALGYVWKIILFLAFILLWFREF